MAQRTQMYYAYFRFYVNEADIIEGMEKFCTEWETMFAVGYNYQEYKCFVDNVGGFEHWVGDMRGYISQTRETGFIDGAPSDSVYDATLLMGESKIELPDMRYLHFLKPPVDFYIRKLDALSAGSAKIKVNLSSTDKISHCFYYAYDEQKIEKHKYSEEISDTSSGVTYSNITLNYNAPPITYTLDPASNAVDAEKALNGNFDDYAQGAPNTSRYVYVDLGSIQPIYNICYKYYLHAIVGRTTYFNLYYGDTVATATNAIEGDSISGSSKTVHKYLHRDLGITGRILSFRLWNTDGGGSSNTRLYQALIS